MQLRVGTTFLRSGNGRTRLVRFFLWLAMVLAGFSLTAGAAESPAVEVWEGEAASIDLAPRLVVFRDPSGTMTLDAVRAAFAAGRFAPNLGPIPAFGYTKDAIWLRVAFHSHLVESHKRFLELRSSRLDHVDWYMLRNGEPAEHRQGGILHPSPSDVKTRYPVLPLLLEPGEQVELYVRVQSDMTIGLPFSAWTAEGYASMLSRREANNGLFYGYMAALVLIGVIFAVFARDNGYLIYSLAVGSLAALCFCRDGHYAVTGLPFATFWTRHGVMILNQLGVAGALFFMRSFFGLKADYPRGERIVLVLGVAALLAIPAFAFVPFQALITFVQLESLLLGFGLLIPSSVFYFKRVRIARFYLLAWIFFWIITLWDILQMQGLVQVVFPPGESMRIALAVSYTLFLVAMADRILENRVKAEEAQALAMEVQQRANAELERKVAQRTRELELATLAAEQANEAKTRFFSNISHDLRAPLNALVGLSQSLWLECGDRKMPEEFIVFLRQIHDGGLYLSQMMDNILDLAAVEAGKEAARIQPFPLQDWFCRNRDIVDPVARRGGLTGQWTYHGGADRIFRGDPVKMSQILLNLALNAVKFTAAGKAVGVTVTDAGGRVEFMVADEGPGIPAAERSRLFERFERMPHDAWLPSKGVGLGLHIVKLYTDLLRGDIRVDDRPGGGTVFTVIIPEAPQDDVTT